MVDGLGRKLALVCVVVFLGSCCSGSVGESDSSTQGASGVQEVRAAICRTWSEHIEAARRKDLDAVMDLYADDAAYVIPGVQEIRGRAAIKSMEAKALNESDVLEAVHTSHHVRVLEQVVYEIGTVKGSVHRRGEPVETVTFHFMAMWRRRADGAWRIGYLVGEL